MYPICRSRTYRRCVETSPRFQSRREEGCKNGIWLRISLAEVFVCSIDFHICFWSHLKLSPVIPGAQNSKIYDDFEPLFFQPCLMAAAAVEKLAGLLKTTPLWHAGGLLQAINKYSPTRVRSMILCPRLPLYRFQRNTVLCCFVPIRIFSKMILLKIWWFLTNFWISIGLICYVEIFLVYYLQDTIIIVRNEALIVGLEFT